MLSWRVEVERTWREGMCMCGQAVDLFIFILLLFFFWLVSLLVCSVRILYYIELSLTCFSPSLFLSQPNLPPLSLFLFPFHFFI